MTSKFIITAFRQKNSNCACVAFIKAMVLQFGLRESFSVRTKGKDKFIRLRNGETISLAKEDIQTINEKNAIVFSKDAMKRKEGKRLQQFTELCFALLVRNMQLKGYAGKEFTETEAIKSLTKRGIKTAQFHELLGVKRGPVHKVSVKALTRLRNKKAVLLMNDRHITILSKNLYEDFGKAIAIENKVPVLVNRKAKYWYVLK